MKTKGDEQKGVDILYLALEQPLRWILKNAGENDDKIVAKLSASKDKNQGFDVMTGEYVDMLKSGIIDPANVTRSALQNAASVAVMILTTEGLVTELPEPEKKETVPTGMGDY